MLNICKNQYRTGAYLKKLRLTYIFISFEGVSSLKEKKKNREKFPKKVQENFFYVTKKLASESGYGPGWIRISLAFLDPDPYTVYRYATKIGLFWYVLLKCLLMKNLFFHGQQHWTHTDTKKKNCRLLRSSWTLQW